MKKIFKNHFLLIIFLLLGIIISGKILITNNKNVNNEIRLVEETKKYCNEYKDKIEVDEFKKNCEPILNDNYVIQNKNFYVKFASSYLDIIGYFNILACLVLFIMSIYDVINLFRDRVAISILQKEKYTVFIKNLFLRMYRYSWFWVVVMLLIFGACIVNSNFDSKTIIDSGMSWGKDLMDNVPMFIILYVLNIFIFSIFYLNIALIVIRKQYNYFLAVVESFLIVIGIELFLEIVIQSVFYGKLLGNFDGGLVFNIMNLFSFNVDEYSHGLTSLFCFNCSCVIISYIILFILYKNKEKVVIDCEKNN